MSPIASTFAGISNRAFGWGYSFGADAFQLIESQTVGAGGVTSLTFSNIPATYRHLQIRFVAALSAGPDQARMTLNGDTTASYAFHRFYGNGSSVFSDGGGGASNMLPLAFYGASLSTSGVGVIDILDYSNTSKNKTLRGLTGYDANGSGLIQLGSGLLTKTNAVTSITFGYNGSATILQNSTFSLFGVK